MHGCGSARRALRIAAELSLTNIGSALRKIFDGGGAARVKALSIWTQEGSRRRSPRMR